MPLNLIEHIRCHGFKRLLLAVSGGLDSICLAHYFIKNRKALGIEWLGIAHVHHGLREGTADRDAKFVEEFAKSHDVPFFLKKLDGEALKSAEGSLEENARYARYKALVEIALAPSTSLRFAQDDRGRFPLTSTSLSTGSGGNDKAETNSLPSTSDRLLPTVSLYRPFLNISRKELLAYARENGLSWCEDESNADVKFARNKIRHEFLPNLEQECPGAIQQLCKIAGLADKAYAKVMAKCENVFATCLNEKEVPAQGGHDKAHSASPQDDTRGFPLTSALPQDDKWRSRNRVRDDNAHSALPQDDTSLVSRPSSFVSLDKKKLNKILREYADADLSEMFRLWLTEKGFRFPIGFFYGPKEPAHVKIPVRAVYRRRSVVKIAHTVWICEFKDALSAAKFVSCEKKEKDYNESTKEASSV